MPLTFDGDNLIIQLGTDETLYTPEYIYSRWKDWVLESDNSKYVPAFRIVGGDPLGGGSTSPAFVFLQNQDVNGGDGWRIRKPEANINVTIDGNLVKEDPAAGFDLNPVGAFSPSLTIQLSNVASVNLLSEEVIPGISVQTLLRELWQIRGLDPNTPVTVTTTDEVCGDITLTIGGDGVNTSTATRTN